MKSLVQWGLLLASAAVITAAGAQSQSGAQPPSTNETPGRVSNPQFAKLDANNDGYISRKEAAKDKDTAKYFSRYDANRDGKLSEDEFNKLKNRKVAEYVDDGTVTTRVKTRLLREKGVKSGNISVATTDGVVTLSGKVESDAQRKRVESIVRKVKGVKQVRSTLEVKAD